MVKSIPKSNIGSIIGKESTGNNAPFVFALDIIADMIVEQAEIPILPITRTMINISVDLISIELKNNMKRITENVVKKRFNTILYNNLPK